MCDKQSKLQLLLPWGAGAAFAVGQTGLTANCTVISQGRCIACAGCIVALVSLVSWGLLKDDSNSSESSETDSLKPSRISVNKG